MLIYFTFQQQDTQLMRHSARKKGKKHYFFSEKTLTKAHQKQ